MEHALDECDEKDRKEAEATSGIVQVAQEKGCLEEALCGYLRLSDLADGRRLSSVQILPEVPVKESTTHLLRRISLVRFILQSKPPRKQDMNQAPRSDKC